MVTVVTDPPSGKVLRVRPGTRLELRFRRGMSRNRWRVAEHPGHLLPLVEPGEVPTQATADDKEWALRFLVFRDAESSRPRPLRLELTRDDLATPADVRRLKLLVTG